MSTGRASLVWGLVVLATLLLLVSSLTLWAKRQLLSTDNWVSSSGQLLQDDTIRTTLATRLVDVTFERTDPAAQLEQRLPKDARGAAPAIAAGLQSAATRAANALLETP